MAGAVRFAGVPVLVIGVLVWLVITVFRAGGAGAPAPDAEFVDGAGGSYLDVQLDRSKQNYGSLAVVIAGKGRVWPKARVSISEDSANRVELHYQGDGFRDPRVTPRSRDEQPRPLKRPERVRLQLAGHVDPTRHLALVDVWVNGEEHRITAVGEPSGAQAVVEDFLQAVRTGDWDTLYSIETSYMRNGSKRREFPVAMANAGVITTVTAARATGPTAFSIRFGASLARTPIQLTYGVGPGATSVDATLVCAVAGGAWGVLSLE
jgi:hypothetical protein